MSRPPKILFLFTEVYAHGGIQRFNQTMLSACRVLNVQCHVLSLQDSHSSIATIAQDANLTVVGFGGQRHDFAAATARALRHQDFDRVVIGHVNLLFLCVMSLALRPFSKPPSTLIAHGIEVWSGIKWTRRKCLARVDSILCVSRYTRQRLLEQAPALHPARLSIFPNALAATWAHRVPASPHQSQSQRFILSVTRLERGDRYKGIVTTIEALSMTRDTSLRYLVIGHGNDIGFLQEVARRCGVAARVQFRHGVSDAELVDLYEKCIAFVLPSGKEGFGIVFLEAMYFGAPVIAAAEKGALDVVKDGETGLLVPYGDSVSLRAAIERVCEDSALRERLQANGRSTVTADGVFTFERFTQRCEHALQLGEAATP